MNENILGVTIAPECPHQGCGQVFNEANLRLAIYLNGIFFLATPEKGIIGFTCPKCQKTVTNSASYNDILKVKDRLANSLVEIEPCIEDDDGKILVSPTCSFVPTLNYLSPFLLPAEVMNELGIDYCGATYQTDASIADQVSGFTENRPELKDKYCSFIGDADNPINEFSAVYWFDDDKIGLYLDYEREHDVRIFPRYHYRTDLVQQINSLLVSNYYMGKTFEQAKVDHEREAAQVMEQLKTYARENNLNYENLLEENHINEPSALISMIEQAQDRVANDPVISGAFLKVLTSASDPLGNISTAETCNYLWAEINPFIQRPYPEFFTAEIHDPVLGIQIQEKLEKHIKRSKLIQENSTKQYVQDFLRKNLSDFIEEYEELIQRNKFSYAHVWRLTESYLEKLYHAVNKGLREEVPYAMYREGEGWKIVFNGKPVSGLVGIGFHWIYYIISSPKKKVYYRNLNALTEEKEKQTEETYQENDAKAFAKANQLSLSDDSVLSSKNEAKTEDRETYRKAYGKLYFEKKEAESNGESAKVERKIDEISRFLNYLDENNIEYKCDGPELKFTSKGTSETKEYSKTKKTIKTEDYTSTKYKIINNRIKKNYRDALTKLEGIREAKELHAHLSKSILKEDGAFIYKPSEDIMWHID